MSSLLTSEDYEYQILKQFDGRYNYFNCTGRNGKVIYRRERVSDEGHLISDIVDEYDNVLLEGSGDWEGAVSYEDPRFIDDDNISVARAKIVLGEHEQNKLFHIYQVDVIKYNLTTRQITEYDIQQNDYEKNWQFVDNKIIYSINPWVVYNEQSQLEHSYTETDFSYWERKYGKPFLSTNPFDLDGSKYILFHSHVEDVFVIKRYHTGVALLDDNLNIKGYYKLPLFDTNLARNDIYERKFHVVWRENLLNELTVADVNFCMNVEVKDNVKIYYGANDYAAGVVTISKDVLIESLEDPRFIRF